MPNRRKAKRRSNSRPLEKAQVTSVGYRDNELYYAIKTHNVQEVLQILENASAVSLSQDGLDKALLAVCRKGHKFLVQSLVRSGASVNTIDAFGSTPLLICAEKGFTDIVRFLVKNGAKINTANAAGDTALILSIRPAGSVDMTTFLLEQRDIKVDHRNHQGDTALIKAVEARDVDTIKLLIDKQNLTEVTQNMLDVSSVFELLPRQKTTTLQTFIKQTADRVGLRSVVTLLHKNIGENEMPVIEAALAHDVDSFNILIDSQFSEVQRIFERLLVKWLSVSKTVTYPDIAIIKTLLAKGANVNGSQDPPIITATTIGSYELVQLLCENGANLHKTDRRDKDPVMTAAENGRPGLIDLLISFGGRVNKPSRYCGYGIELYMYQDSALDLTLRNGHTNCAKLLLKHGAEMNVSAALSSVVKHEASVYLKFLIDNFEVAVQELLHDTKNSLGNRLLLIAVRGGDADVVKALLDSKCNISRSSGDKKLPLIKAEGAEIVQPLSQRGADVNSNSRAQLMISTVEECVVIGHGIDLNTQEEDGSTLLMAAVKTSNTEMVKLLIERGANVNLEDGNGDTALVIAANYRGKTDLLSILIKSGADINHRNKAGYTALMKASQSINKDALQLLISAGADINSVNQTDNATALSVLFDRYGPFIDFCSCAEYLLDQGALASFIPSDALLQVIHDGIIMLVPKLISGGMGPGDGKSTLIQRLLVGPVVSPLCVALIEGNVDLARYLHGNWFLTNFDVASLPRNEGLREILNVRGHNECLAFLDDITSQPASLLKLSFVTVSSAIGCVPGREEKVNSLPLPPIMKEKLLFKREDVTLHIPKSHACVHRSFSFSHIPTFFLPPLGLSAFDSVFSWFD